VKFLAAIDESPAARPVLEVADRLAALFGADVETLHVTDVDVVSALRSEVERQDAVALVIGAHSAADGASSAGRVVLDLVQALDRPVIVVPPNAADRPLRRVVVAIEGAGESHALRRLFEWLGDRPTPEVIVLHVIEPAALPPFADSPVLEADAFEREFLIRVAHRALADPSRLRFEMRVGDAAGALRDAACELDADLVLIAWRGDLSGGHGRVVREMLAAATVPLALLALDDQGRPPPGAV
jgi:nucleotide-binding universal stress UspA family protein